MNKQNIWESLELDKNKPNILKVLKEQAQLLADKTKGILFAEVNPIDTYEEKTLELAIVYNFYIHAPYLGNIKKLIFSVVELGDKIILFDRIDDKDFSFHNSIESLINKIGEIISGKKCKEFIESLYASSLENIPPSKRPK